MATEWHEPYEQLTEATRNMSRAIRSLMEELEAIDWYQQRVDVTPDEELKRVLAHNRDEEKEHAAMVLEWIRRHDPKFDEYLRTYLFKEGQEITFIEEQMEAQELSRGGSAPAVEPTDTPTEREQPTFTVGSLRQNTAA